MGVLIKGRTWSLFFPQARHDRHLDVVAATLPSKKMIASGGNRQKGAEA
jgi:hypothetical protein